MTSVAAELDRRFSAERIEELRARLTRPGSRPAGHGLGGDWELGTPDRWLDELLGAWSRFDVAAFRERLAAGPHRFVEIDGRRVHALVAQGRGPDPLALVLTHGWPGSFLEYADLIPQLTDPAAHGGDASDAFTVIAPSLPGFGFSDTALPSGLTARETAGVWDRLVHELGFERYVAHGSDLGAGVTGWLARDHGDRVAAIHLATPGLAVSDPRDEAERTFVAEARAWTAAEGGYMHVQATKPATLGAALADSPAGLAGWIGEKIVAWSGVAPDGGPAFARERLLETLTLYWATETITTSLLPYWIYGRRPDSQPPLDAPAPTPAAISVFGGERVPFPKPPRSLAERFYAVSHWVEHDTGGHFPAVAAPELLAGDLRAAFAGVRSARA